MIPLRDHNPSSRVPFVTYGLIAANIAVFLAYWPLFADLPQLYAFYQDWALIPAKVSHGQGVHGYITSMFLHGGWMHLLGNMLFLWIYGDNIEDELGPVRFALFYGACGLAAAAAQVAAEPASRVPMVGASGAIAGVMGAYLLMFPRARVDILIIFIFFFRIVPVPAWIVLGLWFALQLFGGLGTPAGGGGVAYWAHAGGFVAGVVLALPMWLRRGGVGGWRRSGGHPPHPPARYGRSSIPVVRRRRLGERQAGRQAQATPVERSTIPLVRRRRR